MEYLALIAEIESLKAQLAALQPPKKSARVPCPGMTGKGVQCKKYCVDGKFYGRGLWPRDLQDEDGNESGQVGPYGPISFGNFGAPTIRFAPKGTKPCGEENTLTVYRGDSEGGSYSAIHTGVKNAITGG